MNLIKKQSFDEGELFNKYLHSRLIRNNKNVLSVDLGGTGSGKSYRSLRKAELWYKYQFNMPYNPKNICFSVEDVIRRIHSGELKRGEVLIFEEAGANLGSLDFQNKISKMFTYVLQSFRSMNLAIFFNLPYLSMLNKQARLLLHVQFESHHIDFQNSLNCAKVYFNQISQRTGKVYNKKMRFTQNGVTKTCDIMAYSLPSPELIEEYERMKGEFLKDLTKDFIDKIEETNNTKKPKELTEKQQKAFDLATSGLNQTEIAKEMGISQASVSEHLGYAQKKGFIVKKQENEANLLENTPNRGV